MSSFAPGKPRLVAAFVAAFLLVGVGLGSAGAAETTVHTTSTTLVCEPAEGAVGAPRTCKATVTDTSPEPITPTGQIAFPGGFRCAVVTIGPTSSGCTVRVKAPGPGSYLVEATYLGDIGHTSSIGMMTLVAGTASPSPISAGTLEWITIGVPTLKLEEAPPKKSHGRVATFKFSSEKNAVRFECKVDKGLFKICTSPFTAKVAPGRHTFYVRAVSATGAYRAPREWRWMVLAPK